MTNTAEDPRPLAPRSGFLRLFVAVLVTCMFAQGAWAVADAIADGRATPEPGAVGFVNAALSALAVAFIPMAVISLPAAVPIALVMGCVAFATERIPSRAFRTLPTLLTIVAAAVILGFVSSTRFASGGSPAASLSGESALSFAALGVVVAIPLAFWATNLGEHHLHQQERLAPL